MGRPVILYVILSGVRQHRVEESVFLFLRMEFGREGQDPPLQGNSILRMEFGGIRIRPRACGLLRMTEEWEGLLFCMSF